MHDIHFEMPKTIRDQLICFGMVVLILSAGVGLAYLFTSLL